MSDRIALRGVRVAAVVGVYAWERAAPRDLLVDLDLELDLTRAGRMDELLATVDYDGLAARIRQRVAGEERRLIEAVAQDVADVCLSDTRVTAATVTVHKPGAVHSAADVAVTIRRTRTA